MSTIPASLQLWSVRDAVKADFAATVQAVADIGYAGVETAGYGNLDATAAATAITAAGLKCSGMHVALARLRHEADEVLIEAKALGTSHVICPFFPRELTTSAAAFVALGEELDRIGAYFRAHGVALHYHNHEHEIARFDGRLGFDWLLDAARPANLGCEPDVYWLTVGGKDPAAFLREQGRRAKLIHLRDKTEIGTGAVDFESVFAAADAVGAVEWYVVEVGEPSIEPLAAVRQSWEKLRSWGRV
ncbi:sugar phosphate isomerase/epimerase family protein [Synoicihabitans lomoniglobus]|uniref:Sugar phosphate isomerase/epimerase n=1 Tax=Synoicihabitans lomoniglobus TaxID=2909285 RepID=A0AAF0CMK6_9BACT|nr:sugar phosphate isomerase/epimerase [Opitutaceae bacterium LMO-M01]WED63170.1 sugar phosphate isomerase/epimerase [Opitutaceae bacterium LMO-M01]